MIDHADSHTAVLFFSHRPEREWQNKQFVQRDYATHRRVAEVFYQHSLQAVRESGLPVLEVTDGRQRGTGFGARFANAVADAFAAGYDRVIAVGSDCPRLHEVNWADVEQHLKGGTPVLGPTPNGDGTYLIGLCRDQFDREQFEGLPWTTASLLPALQQYLERRAGGAPAFLAPRADVNDPGDLRALLRVDGGLPVGLRAQIRDVLWADHRSVRAPVHSPQRHVVKRRSRAPPRSLRLPPTRTVPAA